MFNIVQQTGEYGIVRPNSQADEGYDAVPGERSVDLSSGENPYGITPLPAPIDESNLATDDVDAVRISGHAQTGEYGALPSFRDTPVPILREELPEVFLDDFSHDLPALPAVPEANE
jgi:hypothetical protein